MFMFYCSYGSRRYPAMSLSRSSPAAKRVLFNPTRYGLTLEYRNLPSGSGQSQAAKRFAFESKSTYILMFTGVLCFNFVIEEHISSTHSVHFWDCVRFCTADWKMMFFFSLQCQNSLSPKSGPSDRVLEKCSSIIDHVF